MGYKKGKQEQIIPRAQDIYPGHSRFLLVPLPLSEVSGIFDEEWKAQMEEGKCLLAQCVDILLTSCQMDRTTLSTLVVAHLLE